MALKSDGFKIELPEKAPVICRISKTFQRKRWYVGICPVGLSYGSPMGDRPEIIDDTCIRKIEIAAIDHLSQISGYRRAHFGGECFDRLARGDADEDEDIDYLGMIFSEIEFGANPPGLITEYFSKGLKRVTETQTNLDSVPNI